VQRETDETTDLIDTSFWSAPGDVVVLAGLTRNTEGTTTTGIPGTTGTFAPITPLIGGTDAITNELSETMIFMAPTVIDPSAATQPHSAFRTINRNLEEN
jgi:type II secretory pathway component HofQ